MPQSFSDDRAGGARISLRGTQRVLLWFAGGVSPLCVLQLDDPPQKFNTSVLKNTTNPAWEQPFIL